MSAVAEKIASDMKSATSSHKSTVLIVDDAPQYLGIAADALDKQGFNTITAEGASNGLSMLSNFPIDAILLDDDMPHMSGLQFLKTLRASGWSKMPVLMFSASRKRETVLEAGRYGVRGFILKSDTSLDNLGSRMRTIIQEAGGSTALKVAPPAVTDSAKVAPTIKWATKSSSKPVPQVNATSSAASAFRIPNLVSREATLAAIADTNILRCLPGVANEINQLFTSSKVTTSAIANLLRQDPCFAAKVIQLATASGKSTPSVKSIDDAVRQAGVEAIQNLVAGISTIAPSQSSRSAASSTVDTIKSWPHAMAVAAIAERIVPRSDASPAGFAYLVGLLHDLAEITLHLRLPTEFSAASDFAAQAQQPLHSVFPAVFGVSYAELCGTILNGLKFPQNLIAPIVAATLQSTTTARTALGKALDIANQFAHAMLLTPSSMHEPIAPVLQSDCTAVLIPASSINHAEVRSEAITMISMIAELNATHHKSLIEPAAPRSTKRIGYIRSSSFAALDPVECALANLCQAQVRDEFPSTESELANFDGFVVVAAQTDRLSAAAQRFAAAHRDTPILQLTPGLPENRTSGGVSMVKLTVTAEQLERFIATTK